MSLAGILLGLINIAIWVVLACIIVFAIIWIFDKFLQGIPGNIQNLLWALVGLMALAMLVGLLLGSGPPMLFQSFR